MGCSVGVGRVDLTPPRAVANAGWGPLGRRGCLPPTDPAQRMYATALALEDAGGERVVLIALDLHSGGRHLWRAAVEASGLDASRVLISGTHSHAGPAQRYGGAMYTLLAGASVVEPFTQSHRLAPLVAQAVRQAIGSLTPGAVAVTRGLVADAGSNRAVPAWSHYDDPTRVAFLERGPSADLPPDTPAVDRLRDPRATILAARSDDGSVRAALAWYAVHGTALGPKFPHIGSDLWGFARAEAERVGWTVGFGGGSSGDVTPLPATPDGTIRSVDARRPSTQGLELAETVGRRIGSEVAEGLLRLDETVEGAGETRGVGGTDREAGAEFGPFTIGVAHESWRLRGSALPAPMTGLAQAGGGLDGPSDQFDEVGAGVAAPRYRRFRSRAYSTASGQGPKIALVQAYVPVRLRLGFLWRLLATRRAPLHVVRVGDHAFASVPGEATTMAGWRIEKAVREASGCRSVSIAGFANDYIGYWVTPEEYLEQRYEGSATIYGREAATRLTERLVDLAGCVRSS